VDIFDKTGMDTVGKVGIAADITRNASYATRSTGHTVAHTTELYASLPARNTGHAVAHTTAFHPNIGRNNREHIPVPVRYGGPEQTDIKA
jgi:hypothetical protein